MASRKGKRPANKRLASGVVRGTQTRKGRQGKTRAVRVGQAIDKAQIKKQSSPAKKGEAAPESTFRNPFGVIGDARKKSGS